MRDFLDRADAGRRLAPLLQAYRHHANAIVIGVMRGGLVVANEVARYLGLPLDFILVRKIGFPNDREMGAGAMTENGEVFFNQELLQANGLGPQHFQDVVQEEWHEMQRRKQKFGRYKHSPSLQHKTLIVVDDGIAMGATLKAVLASLRKQNPEKLVLAVPIASYNGRSYLAPDVDEWAQLLPCQPFNSIGEFYHTFGDTSDEEITRILEARP